MGLDLARHRLFAEHDEAGGRAHGEAQQGRTATARPTAAGGHAATAVRAAIRTRPRPFGWDDSCCVDVRQGDGRREHAPRRVGWMT